MRGFAAAGAILAVATVGACSDDDTSASTTSVSAGVGAGNAGGDSAGGAGGQPPVETFLEGRVTAYDYAFDLQTGQARSTVAVDVTAPGNCFALPSALLPTAMQQDDVAARRFELSDGRLESCADGSWSAGDTLTLRSDQVVPLETFFGLQVGFSRYQNLAGGTFSYLLSWVGGCDLFGPCDDHPARFADFRFEVSHPAGTTVLCPGAVVSGATSTVCTLGAAPTYSGFALAADAQWQRSAFVTAAGVDIVFYEVPGGGLAASLDPVRVAAFMDWITNLLGPYPYGSELRVAGGPTAWLGFEHPGNIILREDLDQLATDYADASMHVFMHEVVHQWAGDQTTLADVADFVWKEATAENLSYVFEDEQGTMGEGAATRAAWDAWSQDALYHPRPMDEPTPSVEQFYGDVYGPGPMVLYLQLEAMMGRPAVLQAIQSFLAPGAARGVSELTAALEAASGASLTAYFDAWVYGTGAPAWPSLSATTSAMGDQLTVTVTQANGASHPMAVEVDVVGANQTVTALVDFGLAPTASQAQATITFDEPVQSVAIDPRHRVVDRQPQLQPRTGRRSPWLFW